MSSGISRHSKYQNKSNLCECSKAKDVLDEKADVDAVLADLLAYKSKQTRPKPLKSGFVCALCLRRCSSKAVVKFASCTNSKAVDPVEARQKLNHAVGLDLELEKRTTCRTCWKLIKLIGDFKKCCLKATSNLEALPLGLNSDNRPDDGWMSEATISAIDQNYKVIWKHIEFIDAQLEAAMHKKMANDNRGSPPAQTEQVLIVQETVLDEVKTDEPVAVKVDEPVAQKDEEKRVDIVPQLLKKLPKDLVIKKIRTAEEHNVISDKTSLSQSQEETSKDSPPEPALICIKDEALDIEDDYVPDEISDGELSNSNYRLITKPEPTKKKKKKSKKSTTKKRVLKVKSPVQDVNLDNILDVLSDSKVIAEDEAALLDLLATKDESTGVETVSPLLLERRKSMLAQKLNQEDAEPNRSQTASDQTTNETVTCVAGGTAMLRFLAAKPAKKVFTKRGILKKENQVQVKNLYDVLDVLSTSKISAEEEMAALDLLSTKAKIANRKVKALPTIRTKRTHTVTEITDAALDHYMASVEADENYRRSNKRSKPEDPIELETDHYQPIIVTCDICSRNFDGQHALNVHKIRCSSGAPANEKFVSCPICKATFLENSGLTFHLNRHKGVRPYKCRKYCDTTFFSNYTRIKHERKFCEQEGRICSICGTHLKNEGSLTSHMKFVHGEAKFECKICGMKFRSPHVLRGHARVHSDARKYACTQCDKTFKAPQALRLHLRTHTDRMRFTCHLCEKTFNYKVSLQSHFQRDH